jgi:hypothetical protein
MPLWDAVLCGAKTVSVCAIRVREASPLPLVRRLALQCVGNIGGGCMASKLFKYMRFLQNQLISVLRTDTTSEFMQIH